MFPGLQRIVFLLNLPVDLPARATLLRHCDSQSVGIKESLKRDANQGVRIDRLPMVMKDIACSYTIRSLRGDLCQVVPVTIKGELNVSQGKFISLIGPHGGGKSTLLKVIGGAMLPYIGNDSKFFIPSHLRVLHIGNEPCFFRGTLHANLTLGVAPGDPDGDVERVMAVCQRLGLEEDVLRFMSSREQLAWGEVFSLTQKHLLCIARALVANPDVLVMHKPTLALNEATSVCVLGMLKDFVKNRGVVQPAGGLPKRRARTCIISSSKMQGVEFADEVFHVSSAHGIQPVEKHHVTPEMLV